MPRKENTTNEDYGKALATRLRHLIDETGETHQSVADYLGKSRQTFSYYCDGSSKPDWETLVKIADYFEVSTDYLVGKTEYKSMKMAQLTLEELGLSEKAANRIASIAGAAFAVKGLNGDDEKKVSPVGNPNGYSLRQESDSFYALNALLESDDFVLPLSNLRAYIETAPKIGCDVPITVSSDWLPSFSTRGEVLRSALWFGVTNPLKEIADALMEGGADDGK